MTSGQEQSLESKLFSLETVTEKSEHLQTILDQYKLFVETSEKLVLRRQTANSFFFSINTLIMSAIGLAIGMVETGTIGTDLIALGIIVISVAGILLCASWRSLVQSLAQLNKAKFLIIHLIEKKLPVALFTAEWCALGEGKDPRIYRASTNTEKNIPMIFMIVYSLAFTAALVAIIIKTGCL